MNTNWVWHFEQSHDYERIIWHDFQLEWFPIVNTGHDIGTNNKWLAETYPKLEHIELNLDRKKISVVKEIPLPVTKLWQ